MKQIPESHENRANFLGSSFELGNNLSLAELKKLEAELAHFLSVVENRIATYGDIRNSVFKNSESGSKSILESEDVSSAVKALKSAVRLRKENEARIEATRSKSQEKLNKIMRGEFISGDKTREQLVIWDPTSYFGTVNNGLPDLGGLLMKAYNLTDENAKALSSKLSAALNYSKNRDILPIPDAAPELYLSIKANKENPIDFIDRVWGKYISSGVLFKDQLNKLDKNLLPAIRTYCKNNKISNPDQFMPPDADLRYQYILALNDVSSQEFQDAVIKVSERLKNRKRKTLEI